MKIFITRQIPQAGLELLANAGISYTQWTEKRELTPEELSQNSRQHDALLMVGGAKLDESFLKDNRHLKVIALMSAGYDNVAVSMAAQLGIPVSNTPGVLSGATADTAFLLLLATSRKAFHNHKRIKQGNWNFFDPTAGLGIELNGKTLGIFGLGSIGYQLAKRCCGVYDMPVIYHNRRPNRDAEDAFDARLVSFEELLRQSDVLSVHANLNAETKGIFNKAAFRQMKPSAIFINTARGGLHNEADLAEAVQSGTIWGAGLDVTDPEPMQPDNPLLEMPNVCILPHIGSATIETRNAMARLAAQNIIAGLNGLPLPNQIQIN